MGAMSQMQPQAPNGVTPAPQGRPGWMGGQGMPMGAIGKMPPQGMQGIPPIPGMMAGGMAQQPTSLPPVANTGIMPRPNFGMPPQQPQQQQPGAQPPVNPGLMQAIMARMGGTQGGTQVPHRVGGMPVGRIPYGR